MAHFAVVPGLWKDIAPLIYGWEECTPGHSFGPAIRPYYLLHYVLEGEGEFIREDGHYAVKKDDMFIIRPGEVTTYRTGRENPWVYGWVGFRAGEGFSALQEAVVHQPSARHIFTYIRDHLLQEGQDGMVYSLTFELLSLLSEGHSGKRSGYADYAKTYLDNSYMRRVSIQELADSLHIDRRYLTAQFRRAFGLSPQEYLMNLRLDKARGFLRSGYSVTEAATLAGFGDLANFSRQYKEAFGTNPSAERRGFVLAE